MIGFVANVATILVILLLGDALFGVDPSFTEIVLVVVALVVGDVAAALVVNDDR